MKVAQIFYMRATSYNIDDFRREGEEMRNQLISLLLLLLIGFSMIRIAEAATVITLSVNPAKVPGKVGKNISFSINISGIDETVTDLYTWECKMNWTDDYFNFVGASEGPFLKQGGNTFWVSPKVTTAAGNETVALSSTLTGNVPGVRGSGVLATVTLYVVGGQTGSKFDIFAIKLINSALRIIEPPTYDVVVQDQLGEFALARPYDLEAEFGVIDIYDLAVVGVNHGTNVIRPTRIATSWSAELSPGWTNPGNVVSSNDVYATCNIPGAASRWMTFGFDISGWTGIQTVEVILERKSTETERLVIEVSNNNGVSWSTVTYVDSPPTTEGSVTFVVTGGYPWTPAMISNIAVKVTYRQFGSTAGIVSIDHLQVRVTPQPSLVPVTKTPTTWAAETYPMWRGPEKVGSSDDLRADASYTGYRTIWKTFGFVTTVWTEISVVEVGLERYLDTGSKTIRIEVSNDNGATWSATTYTHTVADLIDTMVWIEVTTAYSWTKTMVENIAVKIVYSDAPTAAVRIDYLAVRVTPTPVLSPPEAFDCDADVNNDRIIDVVDLATVAINYGPYEL
jgi:hypothetical protein